MSMSKLRTLELEGRLGMAPDSGRGKESIGASFEPYKFTALVSKTSLHGVRALYVRSGEQLLPLAGIPR